MLEGGRITARQLIFILVISRLTVPTTSLPVLVSPPANQDVWLAGLLSVIPTMVMAAPAVLLALRFPGLTIIQCCRLFMGKAGLVIGLLYIWFFLHNAAISLRLSGECMTSVYMPETPLVVFLLGVAVICVSAVRNGLEVMARLADMLCPMVVGGIILVIGLVLKEADVQALQPVLEDGLGPVFHGAFTTSPRLVEVLILSMVAPYLNDPKPRRIIWIMAWTLGILTIMFVAIILAVIMVFGASQAQNYTFPFLSLNRIVSIADIIERIDAIHLVMWVPGIFIKVSVFYYLAVLGLSQLLNLRTYRPLILPMGALLVVLSVWLFDSLVALYQFTQYQIWTPYALVFITGFPLLLWVVALVTKKGGVRQ
ncbi:MAG: GerAB/ArcD/ProY family transporter [Bacillota bacterium]